MMQTMGSLKLLGMMGVALLVAPRVAIAQPSHFTPQENRAIRAFWLQDGRYIVDLPESARTQGPWQARQSPEGSTWLLNYYRTARGQAGKVVPTQDPKASDDLGKAWDAWVDAKYAWDEWQAGQDAWKKNQEALKKSLIAPAGAMPPEPGPMPDSLKGIVAEPPAFVTPVMPKAHTLDYGDFKITLQDHTKVRRKFAYYRFHEGVMDVGSPMRGQTIEQIKPLFTKAGLTESQLRVMSAVSLLEGGFDSLNTYDTGFVSVGFIQFASLRAGSGSLGAVMLRLKKDAPKEFEQHFRKFGLDVTGQGVMVALDLATGEERVGPAANEAIIRDKRLAGIFVRAARKCDDFKIAQIRTAVDQYYPAGDSVSFKVGDQTISGKISDVFRSEAGMATLMDRKVNTGGFGNLTEVMAEMFVTYGFEKFSDLAQVEFQLVRAMVYRKNYMEASDLSRPRDLGIAVSRGSGGSRNDRGNNPPPPKGSGKGK